MFQSSIRYSYGKALFLAVFSLCATENEMTPLKTLQDVAKFAGKIVIYADSSPIMKNQPALYPIPPSLQAGYVSPMFLYGTSKTETHELAPLIRQDASNYNYYLLHASGLKQYLSTLSMREASAGEVSNINAALNEKKAKWQLVHYTEIPKRWHIVHEF